MSSTKASAPRYVFLDALRGVAAVWVVIYHLYDKNLVPMTGFHFPQPFDWLCTHGHLGVYMFFVISGFAIAQSLRGHEVTGRFAARYAFRRSIRLDLPYWAAIVAMIVLTAVSNHAHPERSLPMPTAGSVVTHAVYLQAFAGYPDIIGVLWTLRYEVQFYLVLVAYTAIKQRFGATIGWVVWAVLWVAALACGAGWLVIGDAWALVCWSFFALGVAVNGWHHRSVRLVVVAVMAASMITTLVVAAGTHRFGADEVGVAILTAGALILASRRELLATLSLGRVMQWLGRVSYSLYLVHMLVGTPTMRFLIRHAGGPHLSSAPRAALMMAAGVLVSLAGAAVLYRVVERPSHQLSRRIQP